MRRFLLLAALLVPALAHAQDAGPLADRVVAALRVDLAAANADAMADSLATLGETAPMAGLAGFGTMAGALRLDAPALSDSIRAALADAGRPDLLADALRYLESPEAARLQEVMPLMPGTSPLDLLGATAADGPAADSALTARIVRAAMTTAMDPALQREMMTSMVVLMADVAPAEQVEEFEAELDGLDALLDNPMVAQMQEMQVAFMVPLYRALLGGLSDEALRAGAAYYESEAGRHVTTTVMRGTMRYQLPRMVEVMGGLFESMGDD